MTTWTKDELDRIEHADELSLAPPRGPGALEPPTTIWVLRDGGDLCVRSDRGPGGSWFGAAQARPRGRISAGGVERDVDFVEVDAPAVVGRCDAARRGADQTEPVADATAHAMTLKLVPR